MGHRLATIFLIMLTLGFFIYHKLNNGLILPENIAEISPYRSSEMIVHDEFLLLLDKEDEHRAGEVLRQFNLRLISPLGEWLHVAKAEASQQKLVDVNSVQAKENFLLLKKLEAHDAIHSAHLNYIENSEAIAACSPTLDISFEEEQEKTVVLPRDPYFPHQWHLSAKDGIDMPGAWAISTGNPATVIGLVDRNFDFLEADTSPERCSTRHYYYENVTDYFDHRPLIERTNTHHGKRILSAIMPCTDNAIGLSGIDWHAQVFSVDTKADASLSARMFGLLWAAGFDVCKDSVTACDDADNMQRNLHPADVINASFGFVGTFLEFPPYGPVLDVIGRINRAGRVVVASAGNEGESSDKRLPGAAAGVISVGASTKAKQSAHFSNFGKTVDVMAPGQKIIALENQKLIQLNGTSFSAPIVTGVVSLMMGVNQDLSFKSAEYILKATATHVSCDDYCPSSMAKAQRCKELCCRGDEVICARGIINAQAAVAMAKEGIPKTALIDVDDYFIALSNDNNLRSDLKVKNWGRKKASVRIKADDPHLILSHKALVVPPSDSNGVPGVASITLHYESPPAFGVITKVVFSVVDEGEKIAHDQVEAMVEIVPDHHPQRRR